MILRRDYLDRLISYEKGDFIKVITGVRRSGKSTLLEIYKNYLLESRPSDFVFHFNFESLDFLNIRSKEDFLALINEKIGDFSSDKFYHILLDEVQLVSSWEEVVNGLYTMKNVNLVITGSNANLLSSELATLLAGRFVEIKVYPLSFREFLDFKGVEPSIDSNVDRLFQEFLDFGAFPGTILSTPESLKLDYLDGLYSSIIVRDIVARYQLRDADALNQVISFIFEMVGRPIVIQNLVNTIKSKGGAISYETINKYIEALVEAFVLYPVEMFNLKGKKRLASEKRYYICDSGLRNTRVSSGGKNTGSLLENVVYLELLRRGYKVFSGSISNSEIDFVCQKGDEKIYVQVSLSILDEATREREFRSLLGLDDNYPKFIFSLDRFDFSDHGIIHKNLIDWLLGLEG